ncbi:L-idonate 5-dehydrogenase [Rhodobium gokarnense]|uniref:(R,R)-butanediol dehydrogenase/meso-butanediol dehydrogenase/diacetyl reductase/L-idonate 5-dehydrogenase n=1 Tax=Rhodobium gokarnense TaxID=364296 RepID=A0ABT3HB85_9HYPH|nr:L-idonate 5-dehydrogenase [Rhodobium gokarnense]MCW2307657.1 (R,R)-butanediol dehydrogenase/meso-butanediol dehydrogenase/diacetyl reductase/L-idonate 5-dehydrogenase [Rhodobium gokarnense]
MKACVIHAAHDVRLDSLDERALEPDEVRLNFGFGGVCGSDIHYFLHGRVADSIVRAPMILGHEFTGVVAEIGSAVSGLAIGDKVAVNPARPCGDCAYCRKGVTNLCTSMRFMGSAAFSPHENGGFAERPVVSARQCIRLSEDADLRHVAMSEPFAVALHAVAQAGDLAGRSVLVSGAGVIGQLVAVAARRAGAGAITMTDVSDAALARAADLVADRTVNVGNAAAAETLASSPAFDAVFEASGTAPAFNLALAAARPQSTIVQVGFLPPASPLDLAKLLTRELLVRGAYRFVDEFEVAVRAITGGEVDLRPLITATCTLEAPDEVFARATDKTCNAKVMVTFS